jgi:hypothetical protein
MDHFVECIREKKQPRVTADDGRATIAAVEAAYQSYRTGNRVYLGSHSSAAPQNGEVAIPIKTPHSIATPRRTSPASTRSNS